VGPVWTLFTPDTGSLFHAVFQPKVLTLVTKGRSYRLIGRELGLSKNTVAGIVKRSRTASADH
jgi:transposase-like protein